MGLHRRRARGGLLVAGLHPGPLTAPAPSVVVVDDHELFRGGVRELLAEGGITVLGEAGDGAEGVALIQRALPDVAVMDINMPRMDGVAATRRLAEVCPAVRVLVLTMSDADETVVDAIEAGAHGYLLKDATAGEIVAGVRAAADGESVISPRVAGRLLDRMRAPENAPAAASLTERELEVLRLLADGRENAEIAEALVISPRTAKNHVSNVLAKLHVENRIQAAVYAVRKGLV